MSPQNQHPELTPPESSNAPASEGAQTPQRPAFYVTGGTVPADAPSYVERRADRDLFESLSAGEFCVILNSRQMGKSSLTVRARNRLSESGVRTVFLDLQRFGGGNATPEQWYAGMLAEAGRQLGLRRECLAWWKENVYLAPVERLTGALIEVGLSAAPTPLVVFVDEVDAVRSLPFPADEFFAAVRELYNRRVQEPDLSRLTFCLIGSAAPSDLISDTRTSPFNIGRRVELTDFLPAEAAPLARGLMGGQAALDRVLYWTGGHPYLTQSVCAEAVPRGAASPRDVDELVAALFLETRARSRDVNLSDVSNRLLQPRPGVGADEHRAAVLTLYGALLKSPRGIPDEETDPLAALLKLSGIVRSVGGRLRVRNRIYGRVFDRAWAEENLPGAELRRQKEAYRRGVTRASLVAGCAAFAFAALAFVALSQAGQAKANAADARSNADAAKANAAKAQASAEDARRIALVADRRKMEAESSARAADEAAERARTEKGRADRNAERARKGERVTRTALGLARRRQAEAEDARRVALFEAGEKARALTERGTALDAARASAAEQRKAAAAALAAREKARVEAEAKGRLLYAADMSLAQKLWEQNNLTVMTQLLLTHGDSPLRGFEWYYLDRLCHLVERSVETTDDPELGYARLRFDGAALALRLRDGSMVRYNVATGTTTPLPGVETVVASNSLRGRLLVRRSAEAMKGGDADSPYQVLDRSGRVLCTLKGLGGPPLRDAAFSADGLTLAVLRADGAAELRTADTGEIKRVLRPGNDCRNVRLCADGSRLATTGNTLTVWDAATGVALRREVSRFSHMSADGRLIACATEFNTVRVVEVTSGRERFSADNAAGSFRFSPNAKTIVVGQVDHSLVLLDAMTGRRIATLSGHSDYVPFIVFSPDGRRLVTTSWDISARLWDAETGRPLGVLRGHRNYVLEADFTPDGARVVTTSWDRTVKVWNPDAALEGRELSAGRGAIQTVTFAPSGRQFVVAGDDGVARLWDVETSKVVREFQGHRSSIWQACFSPSGRRLLTVSRDRSARVWDVKSGETRLTVRHDGDVVGAAYRPGGAQFATISPMDGIRVWDAQTGAEFARIAPTNDRLRSVTYTPDGKYLVWTTEFGSVSLRHADTLAEVWTRRITTEWLYSVSVSPDSKTLAVAGGDWVGTLMDVRTGETRGRFEGHRSAINKVVFFPDGRRLLTSGWHDSARLWDIATQRPLLKFKGHLTGIFGLAVSPDGRTVITGDENNLLKVWSTDGPGGSPRAVTTRPGVRRAAR